ncbi:MAG TPA: CBS domain-containing protein, partial [Planctomycetota bacterium]|nr:CBS domain-containing protein [Planctomycetota bacterium]
MSNKEHFASFDLDCDDMDAEPAPVPPPRSQRRLRIVRTIGSGAADEEEMRVACPNRDKWPTFDECLECAMWRGYSLDPRGKDSFVTCGELDAPRPIPADACVRGRALRTRVSEVMSDPICVRENVTLDELATIFVSNGISGAPVVDAEGKPVGVVTKTDIV